MASNAHRKSAPTPDSKFQIQLDMQLDPSSAKLLDQLAASMRTAMSSASNERRNLQQKFEELVTENRNLEVSNQQLEEEVLALKFQLKAQELPHATQTYCPNATETDLQTSDFILQNEIRIHDAPVHSVVMGSRSKFFATASWDGTVNFYDFDVGGVVKTFGSVHPNGAPDDMGGLYSVAFAKTDSNIFGCTSNDNKVYLWNCETGQQMKVLSGHQDEVNGIDFHCQQLVMCTTSDDKTAIISDYREGIALRKLKKHTEAVYGASFLGEENQYCVATCCFDKKTRVFDMRDKQVVKEVIGHTDDVVGIDYSSQNNLLATGSDDGQIRVWDTRTWEPTHVLNTRQVSGLASNQVKRIHWSSSGDELAAACSTGCVLIYDFKSGSNVGNPMVLDGHKECVFDVAWGTCPRTGKSMLVSASHDYSCRYWRR